MENYDYATACKPSEHMLHGVETKVQQRAVNMLYVRTGATSKDEILTDLGDFQLATEGIPVTIPGHATNTSVVTATVPIGELWVAYKVKLSRANLYATINNAPTDFHMGVSVGAATAYGSGVSGAGTFVVMNQVQKALYNTVGNANQFPPKRTNTLGTQVWGSTTLNVGYIIFPPGSAGNYTVIVAARINGTVAAESINLSAGVTADITDAQASGFSIPSGLIGSFTAAAIVDSPAMAAATAATGAIPNSNGTGVNNIALANATVGITCGLTTVTFNATPQQIPIVKWTMTQPQIAANNMLFTVQIIPTLLNSQT